MERRTTWTHAPLWWQVSRDVPGVRHYEDMTPAQLVLRGPERRTAELDLVENMEGAPPSKFDDPASGVRIPRFGGAALLRAAAYGLQHGFTVQRIEFDGAGTVTLADSEEQAEISEEVLHVLQSAGPSDAQGFLRHVYTSYMVSGVRFYSPSTRTVTLRRDGVLLGKDASAMWLFIHSVLETDEDE